MKSCVSLHRFRINADPPGGGFNLGNYGDGLRPSVLSAPACSVPQLKKAALFFAGRAAPYNPPREIICLCASTTHLIFLTSCTSYASTMYG